MRFNNKLKSYLDKEILIHFPSMKSFKCVLDDFGEDYLEVSNPRDREQKSLINLNLVEMIEEFK